MALLTPGERQMDNSVHGHLKQLMVDGLPDCGLILVDVHGKVISWNTGAQALLGYTEAEAIGLPFYNKSPGPPDPTRGPPSLAIALKTGRHEEISRRRHGNGADLDLLETVIPLHNAQHTLLAFGVLMRSLNTHMLAAIESLPAGVALKATRVLLVDDDRDVRDTAVNLLTVLGYQVLVAASGAEALDILERDDAIDVLFTDVVMPGGMDGGEVAEKAKLLRPNIKVLFASGYFEEALVKKGSIAANTHLLVKPYRRRDLAKMMNMILADGVRGSDDPLLIDQ